MLIVTLILPEQGVGAGVSSLFVEVGASVGGADGALVGGGVGPLVGEFVGGAEGGEVGSFVG